MKVKLQRTVELSQVPVEVDKVVKECSVKLKNISNLVSSLDTMNVEKFVDQIDFIRRKLFDVDNNLEESSTIMDGYEKTINQETETSEVTGPTESYEVDK